MRRARLLGPRESVVFLLAELTRRQRLRALRIDGDVIYLRTATPDLRVAESSLIDHEYGNIRSSDPTVIVDAGANIGTSAIYFAKRYPKARVFAIEPEQANFEILLENTRGHRNIVPVRAALCGSPGARTIYNRFTGPWGYTVAQTNNRTESTGQQVDCVTMASFVHEHGIAQIDILKMDIEGGEKEVLEGSADWMDRVKVLTIELHDRICHGCSDAFRVATKDFARFEKHGEKVTAYRE